MATRRKEERRKEIWIDEQMDGWNSGWKRGEMDGKLDYKGNPNRNNKIVI